MTHGGEFGKLSAFERDKFENCGHRNAQVIQIMFRDSRKVEILSKSKKSLIRQFDIIPKADFIPLFFLGLARLIA